MGTTLTRMVHRRPFAVWLCAATVSTLGDAVSFFALGWVATGFGGDAASLVLTAGGVPLFLLILVGGQLADRHGIRRVMATCDAAMLVVMGAFAAGSMVGVPLWSLVLVAVLAGTAAALRRPAEGVFPRLFSTPDDLARRMATASASIQLARIAGPALGGLLLGLGGLSLTAGLDALSFGAVMLVLLVVRPPQEQVASAASHARGWRGIADGVRAARRRPGVPALLLTVVGLAITVLPLVMLCVPLAGRARGWSASETGAVSAAWVAGGLVVTLVVARRGAAPPRVAAIGPVLGAAAVAVLATTDSSALAVAAQIVVGVGTTLLTSSLIPAFIASTPPDMLARFQSLLGLAQTGPVLVGTPALGLLAESVDYRAALGGVAVVLAATSVAALRVAGQVPGGQEHEPVPAPGPPSQPDLTARPTATP